MKNTVVFSDKLSESKIAEIIVNLAKNDESYNEMHDAQKYFEVDNIDISDKVRDYVDAKGRVHKNPQAVNTQLKSSFLRQLVQKKQDYAFAKTFILKLSKDTGEEIDFNTEDTKALEYLKTWKELIDTQLYRLVYHMAGVAINKGITWAYVWIDEEGKFRLVQNDPEQIYPIWGDNAHTELQRLVNHYSYPYYNDEGVKKTKEFAEYWTADKRMLFDVDDEYALVTDRVDFNNNPVTTHMINSDGVGISWGKIPFIALKGTDDEKTMLSFVRTFIDCYDMIASKGSDGIQDDIDPLLIFKGISAEVSHLAEAREIAKSTRTMALDTDGDAFYLQAETDIARYLSYLEMLKKCIIQFGYGVDFEDNRFGGNPNQLVVKALYQGMDTYVDGLERQFQDFMDNLKYFFDKYMEFTGKGSFEEYQSYKLLIKLDRSMMINLSSAIDDTIKLAQTGISEKTILEFNPIVQDVDMELERIQKQSESEKEYLLSSYNMGNNNVAKIDENATNSNIVGLTES